MVNTVTYSRISFTKSPASVAVHLERVHKFVFAFFSVCLQIDLRR